MMLFKNLNFAIFWKYESFQADFSQIFKIIKPEIVKEVGNVV